MMWLSVTCSCLSSKEFLAPHPSHCSTHNSELLKTLTQWEFEVNEVEITESVCGILCVKSKEHKITDRLWVSHTTYMSLGISINIPLGFPCGSDGKESACSAGDPGSGRSPGEEHGYPLQYSCLKNPMDRRAWQATDHSVAESDTTAAT